MDLKKKPPPPRSRRPATLHRPSAREAAFQVLHEVLTHGKVLDEVLSGVDEAGLDPRDRALVQELVFGVCRRLGQIRYALTRFARRWERIPAKVQRIMEMSAYQLLHLERVPAYAVVSEAVELTNRLHDSKLGGMVNAVLRALDREQKTLPYPDRQEDFIRYLSICHSHPAWLVEKWLSLWSPDKVETLCEFNNTKAPLTLRLRGDPNQAREALERCGVSFHEENRITGMVVVDAFPPGDVAWLEQEHWVVQDPVMALVAAALDPRPGWRVWDVCAAPGGKTFHLADWMQEEGLVVATDRSAKRLDRLRNRQKQLRIESVRSLVLDPLQDPIPLDFGPFDAILVDASCTGWGTFRRNPDLRWRLTSNDSTRLGEQAVQLLHRVESQVRRGGILLYSTCTLSPDENEHVIERFLHAHPCYALESLAGFLPDAFDGALTEMGAFRGFPPDPDMDGAFMARMRRERD